MVGRVFGGPPAKCIELNRTGNNSLAGKESFSSFFETWVPG